MLVVLVVGSQGGGGAATSTLLLLIGSGENTVVDSWGVLSGGGVRKGGETPLAVLSTSMSSTKPLWAELLSLV